MHLRVLHICHPLSYQYVLKKPLFEKGSASFLPVLRMNRLPKPILRAFGGFFGLKLFFAISAVFGLLSGVFGQRAGVPVQRPAVSA
jgi:hypothetical protein